MNFYYFVGILGSGMSALARIRHEMLTASGGRGAVGGSDRNFSSPLYQELKSTGIKIYPQDGSGIAKFASDAGCDPSEIVLVRSTAIEDTVPDIVEARRLGVAERHRSDLLAELFNSRKGIAVGGTAGKTSVSTMISYLLDATGNSPSFVIGGVTRNFNSSSRFGTSDNFVIESDESDGTIVKYKPEIAILTNISREHKELDELFGLFSTFISNVKTGGTAIFNVSCENVERLYSELSTQKCGRSDKIINFEYSKNVNKFRADYLVGGISLAPHGSAFTMNGVRFETTVIGLHNVENFACAAAAAAEAGVPLEKCAAAAGGYRGVARRLEVVGKSGDVSVIDDYAHNPHEVECAISAVKIFRKPLIAVYQPHGFGPTSFTRHELCEAFRGVEKDDSVFISEVFYGGGTVNRNVTSSEIVDEIRDRFSLKNVYYSPDLDSLADSVADKITGEPGKPYIVLVMGARNVNEICPKVLGKISEGARKAV